MTTILVTYASDAATYFDRDYYVQQHLPLVQELWGPYGLQSTAAFFPAGSGAGTIAVCLCVFSDEEAVQAAFTAPQTPRVMEDVAHFTNARPVRSRVTTL